MCNIDTISEEDQAREAVCRGFEGQRRSASYHPEPTPNHMVVAPFYPIPLLAYIIDREAEQAAIEVLCRAQKAFDDARSASCKLGRGNQRRHAMLVSARYVLQVAEDNLERIQNPAKFNPQLSLI